MILNMLALPVANLAQYRGSPNYGRVVPVTAGTLAGGAVGFRVGRRFGLAVGVAGALVGAVVAANVANIAATKLVGSAPAARQARPAKATAAAKTATAAKTTTTKPHVVAKPAQAVKTVSAARVRAMPVSVQAPTPAPPPRVLSAVRSAPLQVAPVLTIKPRVSGIAYNLASK